MDGNRLQDRRAVITGAASGIGRATAELFAAHGARVLAVDLPGARREWSGDAIVPFDADVAADDTPMRIAAALQAEFGGVDIAFNNAAILRRAPFAEITDALWDEVFAVTLRGGMRVTRELVPLLRRSAHARIVSTASLAALRAVPGHAAYAACKAGLIALTRTMALELGPDGITANAILPGIVRSGMTDDVIDAAREAELKARSPLGKVGEPLDIARVALFFASDDSAHVTGQALAVDGGMFLGA